MFEVDLCSLDSFAVNEHSIHILYVSVYMTVPSFATLCQESKELVLIEGLMSITEGLLMSPESWRDRVCVCLYWAILFDYKKAAML